MASAAVLWFGERMSAVPLRNNKAAPSAVRTVTVLGATGSIGDLVWFDPDRNAIIKTFNKFGVAWTMLPPRSPVNAMLDTLPGWRVLYQDKYAVIHVRAELMEPKRSP